MADAPPVDLDSERRAASIPDNRHVDRCVHDLTTARAERWPHSRWRRRRGGLTEPGDMESNARIMVPLPVTERHKASHGRTLMERQTRAAGLPLVQAYGRPERETTDNYRFTRVPSRAGEFDVPQWHAAPSLPFIWLRATLAVQALSPARVLGFIALLRASKDAKPITAREIECNSHALTAFPEVAQDHGLMATTARILPHRIRDEVRVDLKSVFIVRQRRAAIRARA